jgi:hypothetical protein
MTKCKWCGEGHGGMRCPFVTAVEYYENGEIKRVEFEAPRHIHQAPYHTSVITPEHRDPFELRG